MTGVCPCKSCCHDPHSKYPLECHRAQYIDRFYSPISIKSVFITSYKNTQLIILFHPSNNQVSSWITACLASINAWMKVLSKTSVDPSEETTLPHHSQLFSPTQKAKKNPLVTLDNFLPFAPTNEPDSPSWTSTKSDLFSDRHDPTCSQSMLNVTPSLQ